MSDLVPAEGETQPEPKYVVDYGYLCEEVGHHTCGTGPEGHYGSHEPGCGLEPIAPIEQLLQALPALASIAVAAGLAEDATPEEVRAAVERQRAELGLADQGRTVERDVRSDVTGMIIRARDSAMAERDTARRALDEAQAEAAKWRRWNQYNVAALREAEEALRRVIDTSQSPHRPDPGGGQVDGRELQDADGDRWIETRSDHWHAVDTARDCRAGYCAGSQFTRREIARRFGIAGEASPSETAPADQSKEN